MASERERWDNPNISIEKMLSEKMLWVARNPEHGQGFIIAGKSFTKKIDDYLILKQSEPLTQKHLSFLSEIILNPYSYWLGKPYYRRYPPRPTFAVRLYRAEQYLDVMMDINNPGWEFFHSSGDEDRKLFNWVGNEMRRLFRELFPPAFLKRIAHIGKNYLIQKTDY